jgi:ribonuclease BN (tRNA processing enzyme)
MKIKVLGCSGTDSPGHHLPGLLLDRKILFDAGGLTSVLDEKDQIKIENIFITHAHLDHIIGIPFLADNIIVGNTGQRVTVFAIPSVIKTIKRNLLNSSVWPDFTEIPNLEDSILNLTELKVGHSIRIDGYTIWPYRVNHSVPAVGYLVQDKNMRQFFYTGDIGPSNATWKKLRNKQIHCLIIDVSFPSRMKEIAMRSGHLTPELLRDELSKMEPLPERVYVTHLKTQYYQTIQKELQELGINNLRVLKDGETIRV